MKWTATAPIVVEFFSSALFLRLLLMELVVPLVATTIVLLYTILG